MQRNERRVAWVEGRASRKGMAEGEGREITGDWGGEVCALASFMLGYLWWCYETKFMLEDCGLSFVPVRFQISPSSSSRGIFRSRAISFFVVLFAQR